MLWSVRNATQHDGEQLSRLFDELDRFHREALPQVFQKPVVPVRTKEFVADLLADAEAVIFVAESQEAILGFAHALVREAPPYPIFRPRRFVSIDNVFVREQVRRSGMGRVLIQSLRQWAADQGVAEIELNVWEFNQGGIAFWEKMGFTTRSRQMGWHDGEAESERKTVT